MTRSCQMLLASVLSLLAVSSASAAWPSDGSYLVGSSFRADMQRLDVLQALGSTHARLYAHFAYVVPTLSDVDPTLTVATVDANFAQYSSWLNEQANWNMMDNYITTFMNSSGIVPIIELGEGTTQALPKFNVTDFKLRRGAAFEKDAIEDAAEDVHPLLQLLRTHAPTVFAKAAAELDSLAAADVSSDLTTFDPNVVGRSCYVAYVYLYTRCFLQRYAGGAPFSFDFPLFQLENELNEAYAASLGGQRLMTVINSAWADTAFHLEILTALRQALRVHLPNALATSNLHTDVPLKIHELFNISGFYESSIVQWVDAGVIDFVSFDSYPNMLCAEPIESAAMLGAIVTNLRSLVPKSTPIIVMETGYTSLAPGVAASNGSANWSEANQATYAMDAFQAVQAAGANGFAWFSVQECAGIDVVWTADDYTMLALLGAVINSGASAAEVDALLSWVLGNLSYVLSDFGRIMSQINRAWGTNRADGSNRPVVDTLAALYKQAAAKGANADDAVSPIARAPVLLEAISFVSKLGAVGDSSTADAASSSSGSAPPAPEDDPSGFSWSSGGGIFLIILIVVTLCTLIGWGIYVAWKKYNKKEKTVYDRRDANAHASRQRGVNDDFAHLHGKNKGKASDEMEMH